MQGVLIGLPGVLIGLLGVLIGLQGVLIGLQGVLIGLQGVLIRAQPGTPASGCWEVGRSTIPEGAGRCETLICRESQECVPPL